METIPLFPLSAVLLPQGRMPLQVFEPRYLDLVSRCLKENSGFGVVWLRQGSEVHGRNLEIDPKLAQIGTYASIVDWDSRPNGLLGVTIEGSKKFRLLSSSQREDHLHMAEVEWLPEDPEIALPEGNQDVHKLLQQLLDHPHIARLKLAPEVNDVSTLANLLAQLLPIDERIKFEFLALADPVVRLEKIMTILEEYSG